MDKRLPLPGKLLLRLTLDLVMVITLALLFAKAGGMAFHEIAGLTLGAAIVFHLILGRRWIAAATCLAFHRGTSRRTRICWIVDLLLLVSLGAILLSGILISRVVFSFGGGGVFKSVHYFASAWAVILTGVHLGLHASLLGSIFRGTGRGLRTAAAAAAAALFLYGCFSLGTTGLTRWLAMPFTAAQQTESGQFAQRQGPLTSDGGAASDATTGTAPDASAGAAPDASTGATPDASAGAASGETAPEHGAEPDGGPHDFSGQNGNGGPQGAGPDGGGQHRGGFSLSSLLSSLSFLSMMFLFAVLTWGAEALLRRLRPRA